MTGAGGSIPPRLHLVWLGSEPDAALRRRLDAWRDLHPSWHVQLWRDDDLDWLANRDLYERAPTYAGRSNLARYEIVLREGGYYVDADFDPRRSFEEAGVPRAGLVLCRERESLWSNGFFGAPAGHPFLGSLVDRVRVSFESQPGAISQRVSGPDFLTAEILAAGDALDVCEVPRDLMYPYSFDKLDRGEGPWAPRVIAVHHWGQARSAPVRVHPLPQTAARGAATLLVGRLRERAALRTRLLAAQAQLRTRVQEARWRPQAVDVGDGRALVVARDGAPLVIDLHDVNLLAFTYARGVYDAPFHLLLSRLLSGSDVYVDVGANIGQFVVSAARRLSAYGRVFAYEPQPRAVRTLRLNDYLRRNAGLHQSEVIVREVAVSDSAGEVTLRIPHDHAGRASAVAGTLADVDPALITTAGVPCVTLDDDLADLSHLRLVKIDVEGHEPAVLRGMDGLVRSGRVDFVDVECVRGHLGRGLDDLGGMLASWQALGGRLQRLADDGGLVPLDGSAHAVVRQADRSHLVMDLRPLRQHGGPGTAPR